MAANPKTLRIVDAHAVTRSTRVLEIECTDGPPLESIGGKYVIVNTGAVSGDKAIKRAYSLLPVPGATHRAQLTIKRLEGPGSNAMHAAAVGAELSFSGPWGKLVPEGGMTEPTLVLATDTGITAALGVVEHSGNSAAGAKVEVLWLRSEDETFLDVDGVRSRVESRGVGFRHTVIPPIRSTSRLAPAWAHVAARVAELGARLVVAAGDGAIIHPLRERLLSSSSPVRELRIECFFHNPERKSA
jgi:ferredoxin-NADP reductase